MGPKEAGVEPSDTGRSNEGKTAKGAGTKSTGRSEEAETTEGTARKQKNH
jgi:hypothetical protein